MLTDDHWACQISWKLFSLELSVLLLHAIWNSAILYRYTGGSLFQVLDDTAPLSRDPLGPFRLSVIDKYKDMGTIAMGKSEAGVIRKGDNLLVMPNK